MNISDSGIEFIKQQEGEKLTAYQDTKGIWTIGVGHTGTVDDTPVAQGMIITEEKSSELLRQDLDWVEKCIADNVQVELNQNQYDALCSLIFNIGASAFGGSTVLKELNRGDYKRAADSILMWKRAGSDADILLPRRHRERDLFLS